MKRNEGFTLLELLVTTAILIVLTGIGIPSLSKWLIEMRVENQISILSRFVIQARNAALSQGTKVTLCPLNESNACVYSWNDNISMFTDNNSNKEYEPNLGEKLLAVKSALKNDDTLQYGSTRKALTYSQTGRLSGWGQNATFAYCPKGHVSQSKGIIVATSGRLYISVYDEKSQRYENRNGEAIICK